MDHILGPVRSSVQEAAVGVGIWLPAKHPEGEVLRWQRRSICREERTPIA
jgi:hypothetical protein